MVRSWLDPRALAAGIGVAFTLSPVAQAGLLCPNGAYVSRGPCTLCPDGRYVGAGSLCSGAPLSGYAVSSERNPQYTHASSPHNNGRAGSSSSASTMTSPASVRSLACTDGSAATSSRCPAPAPTAR